MLAATPFRWADPPTWPWVVWAWLAMLLAGCAKPLWPRFQRQRAQAGPRCRGESVEVKKTKPFLISTSPRGGRLLHTAELAYSYTLEGHYCPGCYQREFASEEEGWESVRDLQGKSAMVSYNPRNPAKSLLSEVAVMDLLNARPPGVRLLRLCGAELRRFLFQALKAAAGQILRRSSGAASRATGWRSIRLPWLSSTRLPSSPRTNLESPQK